MIRRSRNSTPPILWQLRKRSQGFPALDALLEPGHTKAVGGRVVALHRGICDWSAGKPLLATLAPPVGSKLR